MRQTEPDVRPLGIMAAGLAVLSAAAGVSYFFSLLAYPAAALAIVLGVIARSEERSRTMGTSALVAVFAVIVATIVLSAL
jgi:hypothetical protein